MHSAARITLIILNFLLLVSASHVEAQWLPEGIAICSAPGAQGGPRIVSDGAGGAIVVWEDYRAGNWDIYAQRICNNGAVLWTADGVPICTETGNDLSPFVASDGSGGAFIAWARDSQTYLQRIDSLGALAGPAGGVAMGPGRIAALIADGEGGAIYARAYLRVVTIYPGPQYWPYCAILVQRMNSVLERQWGIDDVGIADKLEYADAVLAPDGTGGAFVMYEGAFEDPFVVRLDGQANEPWSDRHVVSELCIITDGAGGAIMGTTSVRKMNASGDLLWGDAAVETGVSGGLVSDGAGGAIVGSSIVQRIDSAGSLIWGASGAETGVTGKIVSDGAGGAIVGSTRVQRVGPEGLLVYPAGGLATGATASAVLASDGMHGVYLAWSAAGASSMDIFVQRIPHGSEPALDSPGDRRADVGSELAIDLVATSSDPQDSLVYWTNAADVLESPFAFDEQTGEFRWSPLMADAGEYRVTFGVRGRWGGDFETITILVYYDGTRPPRLDPIPKVSGYEGYPVVIEAHAFDPDGDELAYSISDGRFAQNGNVFTWRTRPGDSGEYYPVVAVTDGILADSVAVLLEIGSGGPAQIIRDPMSHPAPVNAWQGNLVTWDALSDGFLSASESSWNAAVVSDSALAGSGRIFIVRIEHKTLSTDYMLGVTDTPSDATDFGSERIDVGIYLHSSGSIRPTWDCNNANYWDGSIPAGLYDIRISLDAEAGSAAFAIDDVPSIEAPLASFTDPVWSAVESRSVPAVCYMQINPYNSAARVYDVWRPGVAMPDAGGTLLDAFEVSETIDRIRVEWTLVRCSSAAVFTVMRAAGSGNFDRISDPQIYRAGLAFTFVDQSVVPGTAYRYRIDVEDEDGRKTLFETSAMTYVGPPPPQFLLTLGQNYPNPFNPGTMIEYTLPVRSRVVIDIYDVQGRLIRRLVDSVMDEGPHSAPWDGLNASGRRVGSGVYFYRLAAGGSRLTRTMVIMK